MLREREIQIYASAPTPRNPTSAGGNSVLITRDVSDGLKKSSPQKLTIFDQDWFAGSQWERALLLMTTHARERHRAEHSQNLKIRKTHS